MCHQLRSTSSTQPESGGKEREEKRREGEYIFFSFSYTFLNDVKFCSMLPIRLLSVQVPPNVKGCIDSNDQL